MKSPRSNQRMSSSLSMEFSAQVHNCIKYYHQMSSTAWSASMSQELPHDLEGYNIITCLLVMIQLPSYSTAINFGSTLIFKWITSGGSSRYKIKIK
mmetsp:Transcript_2775/g.7029  ORF Transcript_2775/g.7029 Transcript_2775/m.7029 type:complete len:96 (-) Transcript_2775:4305-4592(-)